MQVQRTLAQDTSYFQIVDGVAEFYSPLRPCYYRMGISWNKFWFWTCKGEALPLLFKIKVGNFSCMLCQTLRSSLPVDAQLELRGVASQWSEILLSS